MDDKQKLQQELSEVKKEFKQLYNKIVVLEKKIDGYQVEEFVQDEIVEEIVETVQQPVVEEPKTIENRPFVGTPIESYKAKQKVEKKQKMGLEGNIGKNIMGILASLLIFIGLGSFVVLMLDSMTDEMKMALMYLFSFGLIGVGLWRHKIKPNAFSTSLVGCGIGSTYLSLLVTFVFFAAINDITFFVLLAVWAIISLTLERRIKTDAFSIIGMLGVSISVIMAVFNEPSEFQMLLVLLFFAIFGLIYFCTGFSKRISSRCVLNIVLMITSLIMAVAAADRVEFDATTIGYVGVGICLLYNFVVYAMTMFSMNKSVSYNSVEGLFLIISTLVNNTILIIVSCADVYLGSTNLDLAALILFVVFAAVMISYEYFERQNNLVIRNILMTGCIIALMIFWGIMTIDGLECFNLFGFLPFIAPIFIYGLYSDDRYLTILSEIILFGTTIICLFIHSNDISYVSSYSLVEGTEKLLSTEFYLYSFLHIALFGSLFKIFEKSSIYRSLKSANYTLIGIIITYLFYTFGVYLSNLASLRVYGMEPSYVWEDDFKSFIILFVASILVLIPLLSKFCYKWNKIGDMFNKNLTLERQGGHYLYFRILNAILLLYSFAAMNVYPIGLMKLVIVLLSSIQCYIGMKELLVERNSHWCGFYVGIKSTLYMNLVLFSFIEYSEFSYICSILCLILAICAIVFGFNKNLKSFRLYGLYLSIFSVLKLLLIDLTYSNSLLRVFSFIGAGLLCFVIVWIYNKMSERSE